MKLETERERERESRVLSYQDLIRYQVYIYLLRTLYLHYCYRMVCAVTVHLGRARAYRTLISSSRPSNWSTVCLSLSLSCKRRGTVLLGTRRDRKTINTIVLERGGRERGRERESRLPCYQDIIYISLSCTRPTYLLLFNYPSQLKEPSFPGFFGPYGLQMLNKDTV